MAKSRVTATLPDDVYAFLAEWAEREGRPISNLAAYILISAVRDKKLPDTMHHKNLIASLTCSSDTSM